MYVIEKVNENENEIGAQQRMLLRQQQVHFQSRSFSFAVFHRIKITIIYISGIDASMTYSNSNTNSIGGVCLKQHKIC